MKAYITVLSSDLYFLGVLVLYKSVINTNTKYPFYVAVTEDISETIISELNKYKLNIIKLDKLINFSQDILNSNIEHGYGQWNNTLQKLGIFQLTQFKKIVYLDSDMMVTSNIDHLFDKEHMSAVVAGALMPENKDWKLLNSGIMIIEPKQNLGNDISKCIKSVIKKKKYFGDQDLIQEYYSDWSKNKKLNLDHKYNVFIHDLEYYCNNCGYNTNFNKYNDDTISVVHFVGEVKPWMISNIEKIKLLFSLVKSLKYNTLRVYLLYFKYIFNKFC